MTINSEVWQWAQWASEKTGIAPEIIYTQWSLEAGEGGIQNPASLNYNLAGLTVAGKPGIWRRYGSLSEFAWDYVYSFLLPGYPGALGAQDINKFAVGLKQGKWGSYYGEESIESYTSKLMARYKSLFGNNQPANLKPIFEGQTIGPDTRPAWRKIWDNFIDGMKKKLGITKPDWQQELEARENVIEKAKEKGIPISPKFEENTRILRDYKKSLEKANKSWIQQIIERGFFLVTGLVLFLVGAFILVNGLIPKGVTINAGNKNTHERVTGVSEG